MKEEKMKSYPHFFLLDSFNLSVFLVYMRQLSHYFSQTSSSSEAFFSDQVLRSTYMLHFQSLWVREVLTTLSLPLNLPKGEFLGSSWMPTVHLPRMQQGNIPEKEWEFEKFNPYS